MALTGSESAGSVMSDRVREQALDDDQDGPGWISRWASRDPVRAVAVTLIVVQLATRAEIASRGFLAQDDFLLASRTAGSELTPELLFNLYINHLMPGGMLITWLITRATGLAHWPYVLLLIAGQAVVSIAFYRLLRLLFRPGWGLLIPLCVLLFSPLTLETTSWWWSGANVLPMELATILAIGAQVKYVRTRRRRHLVTLALSVMLGLLFFEKSLLIVPLVFLVTACLFVTGGPFRSTMRALRRYWPSWLVVTVLSAAYLWFYLSRAHSSLRSPASAGEVVTFLQQLIGHTLIPGLLGGPWVWLNVGDAAPLAAPSELARWLAWALFLALAVVTVWLRRAAVRAWVLFGLHVAVVAGVLASARLGYPLSPFFGLVPRYISDVVVVAAICIGVALLGIVDTADRASQRSRTLPIVLREPGPVGAGLVVGLVALVAFSLGSAWSTARFGDIWSVKHGREYLHNAQKDLAAAPAGTVFFDQTVPQGVVGPLLYPYNLQSNFFRPVEPRPVFVTEVENLSVFDDTGRIRPATIEGVGIQPGPAQDCGHRVSDGQTVQMPLKASVFKWQWAVWFGYISSGDSNASLRIGGAAHVFRIHRGWNQIFFLMEGEGGVVEVTVSDPTVTLCTNSIVIGNPAPKL